MDSLIEKIPLNVLPKPLGGEIELRSVAGGELETWDGILTDYYKKWPVDA